MVPCACAGGIIISIPICIKYKVRRAAVPGNGQDNSRHRTYNPRPAAGKAGVWRGLGSRLINSTRYLVRAAFLMLSMQRSCRGIYHVALHASDCLSQAMSVFLVDTGAWLGPLSCLRGTHNQPASHRHHQHYSMPCPCCQQPISLLRLARVQTERPLMAAAISCPVLDMIYGEHAVLNNCNCAHSSKF